MEPEYTILSAPALDFKKNEAASVLTLNHVKMFIMWESKNQCPSNV
jgi:hypothetical protein